VYTLWAPNVVWKLFDMFIGAIQAFIFALLTVLYFGAAGAHDESHDEDEEAGHGASETGTDEVREQHPELVH
jgi:F-type H+-transporting ATPase subunit a